jgi:hypothetical protein
MGVFHATRRPRKARPTVLATEAASGQVMLTFTRAKR